MKPDVKRLLVVGAGVTGSVIGHLARVRGYEVTWFDDRRAGAASPASAGLCWSPLRKDETDAALALLDELYGLRYVSFARGVPRVPFVSPERCLAHPERGDTVREERVTKIGMHWLETEKGMTYAGHVVLATGCWVGELVRVPIPEVRALAGSAFIWDGPPIMPVRQEGPPGRSMVGFERDPGRTWAGDGTALLRPSYTDARVSSSRQRCALAVHRVPGTVNREITGYVPYVKGEPRGVCAEIFPRTWMVTGGGKSGTILAAHHALSILGD